MGIEIINCPEVARETKARKVVMNTRKMHAWEHYLAEPGDGTDMHCHPGDQTFICLEGECTMHFPDGGKAQLDPGMAALITGGSFYMLENTGDGPMVMMGNRSGNQNNIKHINYDTRKDLRAEGEPDVPFHKAFDENGALKQ